MASGLALAARFGQPATEIHEDDPIWEIEAEYLALGLATCVLTLSPHRIVIGGGVVEGRAASLLPKVRRHLGNILHGYIDRPEVQDQLESYLVAAKLRDPSPAICGALWLAAHPS